MSTRTFLLFATVLALAYSTELFTNTSQITLDEPFLGHFGPFNVQTSTNITLKGISSDAPVAVCIAPSEFGLPRWNQYSSTVCPIFLNVTADGTITVDKLLQYNYTIGVYYSIVDVKKSNKNNITVTIEAPYVCEAGQYWNPATTACVEATAITSNNLTATVTLDAAETKYFTYENTPKVGSRLSKVQLKLEGLSPETFVISARFNGAPSQEIHDAVDNNGTLTVLTPKTGLWVIGVHASSAGTADLTFSVETCEGSKAGEQCEITVADAVNNLAMVLKAGQVDHYRIVISDGHNLVVSVTSNNSDTTPFIYAARGQLPSQKSADIMNCNRDYCNVVRSIAYNVTANSTTVEEWFITVVASVPSGNATFGLWFNTSCVAGCTTDNHGTCNEDGTCECQIDFDGLDCSVSKGLGPQYIVLIIIASLVVASAIIGFVAWAYMRRKRANYEILS